MRKWSRSWALAGLLLFLSLPRAFADASCSLQLTRAAQLPDRTAEVRLPDHSLAPAIYLMDKPMRDGRIGQVFYLPETGAFAFLASAEAGSPALDIPVQVGPTCAVHSARNCLLFLLQKGLLPESRLKHLLETDPDALFAILHQHVSAEAWEKDFQELAPGTPSLFTDPSAPQWLLRFETMGETQADRRKRLFEDSGLSVEIVHSVDRLVDHLREGYPAFVDTPVRPARKSVFFGEPLSETDLRLSRFDPSFADDPRYFGWHSVLAIAVIDVPNKAGGSEPYALILDSAYGEPRLWKASDIAPALALPYSMTASLVKPKSK